jgi:hypothetical protein
MDYYTWMRMKRGQILAGITNFNDERKLDKKDVIVRDIFASKPVLVKGVQENVVCCTTVENRPIPTCPEPPIIVDPCPPTMHQY